jgi:4-hydroxy-3-polyprenylbenzoate decarboxylase
VSVVPLPAHAGGVDRSQDLRDCLADYRRQHPDDVLVVEEGVSADQDVTALVWELAARGREPVVWCNDVDGRGPLVTNLFASRPRIAHWLGADASHLHEAYQQGARQARPMREVETGPVLDEVAVGDDVDLTALPLITHFESDLGPYITNGIIVAEEPGSGVGNLSYHRAVVLSPNTLGTSLHSRGDLWRMLEKTASASTALPVAMVLGAHPLFMLAASARVPFHVDEREIAGGLLGEGLEVVRTPIHGLRVPASAEYVLEGVIDPRHHAGEGPFGEFSGYSSDRSTHNRLDVEAVLHRRDGWWVDVVGGNSDEHLNLARVPREAEMIERLKERFACVVDVHYPRSGTHFHCYVSVRQRRAGEARQAMLGLLGWDPYLKTVIAVDDDVDITDDSEVLWSVATRFQPAEDIVLVERLPGSALDPSSTPDGSTSRVGLDATRGPAFSGTRIQISAGARDRAARLLERGT